MGKTKTISADLKEAMRQKEAERVSVLRLLAASLHNAEIEKGKELSEADETQVLKKEAKKRREAIEMYKKAGREELADKETAELKVIKGYLPEEMDEGKVREMVKEMKEKGELGDDFGTAMRAAMGKLKGQADGKLVAEIVKAEL